MGADGEAVASWGLVVGLCGAFLVLINAHEWLSESGLYLSNRRIGRARLRGDTEADDRLTKKKLWRTWSGMATGLLFLLTALGLVAYGLLTW